MAMHVGKVCSRGERFKPVHAGWLASVYTDANQPACTGLNRSPREQTLPTCMAMKHAYRHFTIMNRFHKYESGILEIK